MHKNAKIQMQAKTGIRVNLEVENWQIDQFKFHLVIRCNYQYLNHDFLSAHQKSYKTSTEMAQKLIGIACILKTVE